MSIVVINNALVLSQRTGESSRTGAQKVSLHISEKVYDPAYPQKLRYNNYWVSAYGELAERISHMGIKEKSSVNVTCKMDFMKDVRESETETKENDGRSRFVKGLIFELLDISYAVSGISQESEDPGKKEEGADAPAQETEEKVVREVPIIDLDKNNILLTPMPKGKVYGGTYNGRL